MSDLAGIKFREETSFPQIIAGAPRRPLFNKGMPVRIGPHRHDGSMSLK
ncbi:hypothetical protein [Rhizobium nepotum]|nr:hypothetical protein [Rhizobium nepotum]